MLGTEQHRHADDILSKPILKILTSSLRPNPILPIDYTYFLFIHLPTGIERRPFQNQLLAAADAVQARGSRHHYGPFGFVLGHAFRPTPTTTIYLDRAGEFSTWEPLGLRLTARNPGGMPLTDSAWSQPGAGFVVGTSSDGFCSLLPAQDGLLVDDQNLEDARIFSSLAEAVAASVEFGGSVFEVERNRPNAALRELMVDLAKVNAVPLDRCYRVGELLLVGPILVGATVEETRYRRDRLFGAGVQTIVSLLSRAELLWLQNEAGAVQDARFELHHFPVADGEAPSDEQMTKILDVIDDALVHDRKIYLHCIGGRGRSGCVVACLLARHGIVMGQDALNRLAEIRYAHGLFTPSPETDRQRAMVIRWRERQ